MEGEQQPALQSKKALKKAAKRARFEESKAAWRKEKRERDKARRKLLDASDRPRKPNKRVAREQARLRAENAPQVVIDASFEAELDEKTLTSLVGQLGYCNAMIKSAARPLQLHVTGLGARTEALLAARSHSQWVMRFHAQDFPALFPAERLVYLSGDAAETMEAFDPAAVYVIGGLVDRNRLKNATLGRAEALGLRTQRLPIDAHLRLATSSILTVNQCSLTRL